MSEYTFTMRQYDGTVITISGTKENIDDVLEDFKCFLAGCGFYHEHVEGITRTQKDPDVVYNKGP